MYRPRNFRNLQNYSNQRNLWNQWNLRNHELFVRENNNEVNEIKAKKPQLFYMAFLGKTL